MNSFNEIQKLVNEDRLKEVDTSFYSRLEKRISTVGRDEVILPNIKKLHLSYGVVAGLLLGLFIGGIVQHRMASNKRISMMQNVLEDCCMNEMQFEHMEYQMLKEL